MMNYNFTIKKNNWDFPVTELVLNVDEKFRILSSFINLLNPIKYPAFLEHVYAENGFSGGDYSAIIFNKEIDEEDMLEGLDFPNGYVKILEYGGNLIIREEDLWQILCDYAIKLLEIFERDKQKQFDYYSYIEKEKKAIPQDENIRTSQWYKEAYTFRDTLLYNLNPIWSEAMKEGIKKLEDKIKNIESGRVILPD